MGAAHLRLTGRGSPPCLALALVALLGCQAEAQTEGAAWPRADAAASAERCRTDLLDTLDAYRDLGPGEAGRRRARHAMALVTRLGPGELAPLAAACTGIGEWKRAALDARARMAEVRRADAQGLAGVAAAGDLPGAPYSSRCGSGRSDTEAVFLAQVALQVARGVWSVASRGCEQVAVVCPAPGGGNTSLACVVVDTALFVAEAALEDVKFCDGDVDSAEIRGTYDRVARVHDEIVLLDGKLDQLGAKLEVMDGKLDALARAVEGLRLLGCDQIRLETTPHGRRESDIAVCADRPEYPYAWPER